MKPEFSELSFAFAYMADLAKKLHGTLSMAPSFPSTVTEGKTGYGYDVKLTLSGVPVFLQFKLSHCMRYKSAVEFAEGKFSHGKPVVPVYRFYLMALGKSRQTSLMLRLEKRHDFVFYVAPAFHKTEELNSHFVHSSVESNSRPIRPSKIRKMPDRLEHFVSYRLSGPCYRFSEAPALVEEERESLPAALNRTNQQDIDADTVLESLLGVLSDRGGAPRSMLSELRSSDRHPALIAQHLARTYFGCELAFFSRERPTNSFNSQVAVREVA